MPTIPCNLLWGLLSGLGSANLTIALALAFAVFLIGSGDYRMARWWCLLFFVVMLVVSVTKLAFVGWGIAPGSFDFTGASGHAARAAAVYPVLFFILAKDHGTVMQRVALGAALLLAAGIACSRLVRQVHSLSEVAAGLGIGVLAAGVYVRLADSGIRLRPAPLVPWLGIVALCAASLPAVPTQAWLVHAGLVLSGRQVPYTRQDAFIKPRTVLPRLRPLPASGARPARMH